MLDVNRCVGYRSKGKKAGVETTHRKKPQVGTLELTSQPVTENRPSVESTPHENKHSVTATHDSEKSALEVLADVAIRPAESENPALERQQMLAG